MGAKKDFDIQLLKLKNGVHSYEYTIGDSFFDLFEQSSLHNGNLVVKLSLEKNEATNMLNFNVSGKLNVECDRCLDEIGYPIESDYLLTVKISDEEQPDAEDILVIPTNNQTVNVADTIYEIINLALPLRRLCEDIEKECNEETVSKLKDLESGNEDKDDDDTDPRWDKLRELLN